MDLALDCANGATSAIAPRCSTGSVRGWSCVLLPQDGSNINDRCGATHPEALSEAVRAGAFEFGLAFDGDGDRLIAVDHSGAIVDGDHIIAICALDLERRGCWGTTPSW